jgi:PAS domain S-box-containing protein
MPLFTNSIYCAMRDCVGIILTDASRRILWVNDDFTEMTGYSIDEVIGKKPSLLQGAGTDWQVVERIRQQLKDLVSFKEELTNHRKNGEPYPCKLLIHPIFGQKKELTNYIAFEVDGSVTDETQIPALQLKEKYASSHLREGEVSTLFVRLLQLVQSESLFLQSNITLKDVSDRLKTNTTYLSQVINRQTNGNFHQFINRYRIDEVQKRISSEAFTNYTLYGIALECGFRNKSTFYKVFREITSITPNEYAHQLNRAVE